MAYDPRHPDGRRFAAGGGELEGDVDGDTRSECREDDDGLVWPDMRGAAPASGT